MRTLKTIEAIKTAVDNGETVYADSTGYQVIKDRIGQYLIVFTASDYCIGLTGLKGTKYENQINATTVYTLS